MSEGEAKSGGASPTTSGKKSEVKDTTEETVKSAKRQLEDGAAAGGGSGSNAGSGTEAEGADPDKRYIHSTLNRILSIVMTYEVNNKDNNMSAFRFIY